MIDVVKQCVEVKDIDSKKRRVVGLISTDEVDRHGERVNQKSLADCMPAAMKTMSVVYLHQYGGAIGHPVEWTLKKIDGGHAVQTVTELGKGYNIPTFFGIYSVDDIWAQVEQGHLRTHSIGFKADRIEPRPGDDNDVVPELIVRDLFEYSFVVVPSARGAVIEQVMKAAGLMPECTACREKQKTRQEQALGKLDISQLAALMDETREALTRAERPHVKGLLDLLNETTRAFESRV